MMRFLVEQQVPLWWFVGGLALIFLLALLGMCLVLRTVPPPCQRPHADQPVRYRPGRAGPRTSFVRHQPADTQVLVGATPNQGEDL